MHGVLQSTYSKLGENFSTQTNIASFPDSKLVKLNSELAKDLDINISMYSEQEVTQLFSGQKLFPGSEPIAQVYAGHQFGYFNPQLGDGRAVLLGEVINKDGKRKDIGLKGSGKNKYSRGGDGKAHLGAIIREYIMSEAMHHLGIPTTRALALVSTGENVIREDILPGGILTRVASSHIRIGTFEYFAARGDSESLKTLLDYSIERHYSECIDSQNPYEGFFKAVVEKQSDLIVNWMRVGFIHGVMNTDNILISGETIDYGPCAFMDGYHGDRTFSSIDQYGRYSFINQREIIFWNLEKLGICLLPFCGKEVLLGILEEGKKHFEKKYVISMNAKIGLVNIEDRELFDALLGLIQKDGVDYTLTFRKLSDVLCGGGENEKVFLKLFSSKKEICLWLAKWKDEIGRSKLSKEEVLNSMNEVNPLFIPRNHRVEEAISHAVENSDYSYTHALLKVLEKPYENNEEFSEYSLPPEKVNNMYQTFCGT